MNPESSKPSSRRSLTMGEYIRRRNGVPLGARGGLQNMLRRSLGARSFAVFWQYWNPIFGYALGRYVFAPLKHVLPPAIALLATFVCCGALHDAVTMAVRGSFAFLFTPWFFFLGLGVLIGRAVGMDMGKYPWAIRAAVNLAYLSLALTLAVLSNKLWGI